MSPSWKNRRFTNLIRYSLDNWLPPVLRDNRLLFDVLAKTFHGPNFDLDFKRKAHAMSNEQFIDAYARLTVDGKKRYRATDMTDAELDWMVGNALGPQVLEVGCGHGVLARRLAQRGGVKVTASDLSKRDIDEVRKQVMAERIPIELAVADGERLPFADKSFDTVMSAHTLEHVRNFERAVSELVRVARRRLLVVVPCQRFYRYTVDYHLHFFPEPEQLVLRMGLPHSHCERITGDLCYRADLSTSHETTTTRQAGKA